MNFRLLGINFKLSFGFFAVLSLFLIFDKSFMAGKVLLAILIHEMGHLTAFYLCGISVKDMSFTATGITMGAPPVRGIYREVMVHMAGAFFNLVSGLAVGGMFGAISLCLAAFNLLPIGNLDGGNIIKAFLVRSVKPYNITLIFALISLSAIGALMFALMRFADIGIGAITLLPVCAYLIFAVFYLA